MSTRGVRITLRVAAGISIALVLATAIFRLSHRSISAGSASSNSGLCGEAKFDFGTVTIQNQPAQLEHVFELINCSGAPMKITRAIPSCGCTVVRVPDSPIEVAGRARIAVTLTLSDPGLKSAQVALEIAGEQKISHLLILRAVGRRSKQLLFQPSHANLHTGVPVRVTVFAVDQDSTSVPSAPTIAAPDEVAVEVGRWELVTAGAPERGLPTRWECRISLTLRRTEEARRHAEERELRVMVSGYAELHLDCRLPEAEGSRQP
jgi:hypothetical protein